MSEERSAACTFLASYCNMMCLLCRQIHQCNFHFVVGSARSSAVDVPVRVDCSSRAMDSTVIF